MANENRLIDANALCESFEKAAYKCEHIEDMVFHLDYILDEITGADEVDAVEVVHGRWIDDGGLDEDGNGQYRCSHCGVGEKHNPTLPVSYCWNCGAKMDGGNENG